MLNKRCFLALASVMVLAALLLSGCGPQETPTPEPEPELGSEERPIQVYFVPSTEVDTIVAGGEVMAQALEEATGLKFEVKVPTSYAAAIEGMCAAPEETMGFPATLAYVVANARCGVDASFISVRYGSSTYHGEILVPRESDMQSLTDLNGKKWGYTDATSTSGHMIPMIMLAGAGVEVAEKVPTGGHTQAVLAVYNGEVDFATVYFNAPSAPEGEPDWEFGDDPEPYADIVDECAVDEEGDLYCGGYKINDARNRVVDTAPDVVQKLRILTISDPIPNDCVAFGPDFPSDLRSQIEEALLAFKETEEWETTIGDFYTWHDMAPTTDATYDVVRDMIAESGYSMDEVVGILEGE